MSAALGAREAAAAERAFLTELARFVRSDAFGQVLPWYRRRLAAQMLDATTPEQREELSRRWVVARDLLMAMDNEVQTREGEIDGRANRYKRAQA